MPQSIFISGSKHFHGINQIFLCVGIGLAFCLSSAFAQTTATVNILNTPNAAGDIVVSKGTSVEVEFDVTGDSSKNDELQLIRIDDNAVVSKKKRGTSTIGTVSLDTNAENAIATLRVDYVYAGNVVSSAPDQVVVVADDGMVVLSEQIADLTLVDATQAAQISTNTSAIATNAGNITTNTGDISALSGVVGGNLTDIGTLQTDIGKLQNGLTGLIPKWNFSDTLGTSNIFEDGVGNIGIGTTNPGNKLQVLGSIAIGDIARDLWVGGINFPQGVMQTQSNNLSMAYNFYRRASDSKMITLGQADAYAIRMGDFISQGVGSGLGFYADANVPAEGGDLGAPTLRMLINSTGNVGIGTTTPGGRLEIQSNDDEAFFLRRTPWASGDKWKLRTEGNPGGELLGWWWRDDSAGTETRVLTIRSNGNVGIGIASPTSALHVNGTAFATGGHTSSRALKENISGLSLQEANEALNHLNPIKFTYKADTNKDLQIGFIAEDVPELVSTPGRKGIQPMDIIAILTKITQDQQKQIEELKAHLSKQNETLKARVQRLEAQFSAIPVSLH